MALQDGGKDGTAELLGCVRAKMSFVCVTECQKPNLASDGYYCNSPSLLFPINVCFSNRNCISNETV